MKKSLCYLFAYSLLILIGFSGCSGDDNGNPAPEITFEYLVSSEQVAQVSTDEIRNRYPAAALLVTNAVTAYKIVYKTQYLDGSSIEASGLVLVPANKTDNLTLLSFQHGTMTTQEEAPSAYQPVGNMEAYLGGTVGASLAKGYIVVMPDYIGYGASSNVQHPYEEKTSLAQACLDMLKATKEFAESQGLQVKKEIKLLGYSEGGYATMALHQAIEAKASDLFTVEASYPGAGSYDMVGSAQWVVSQNQDLAEGATSFYLWTLLTYNQIYGINTPLTDLLQPAAVQAVNDALAQGNPMAAQISNNPSEVFSSSFIEGIQQGTNEAFLAALQQNNVYDWKPNAPVFLFHAEADDIVPVSNAQKAETTMTALGAQVQFVSLGDIGHREGANKYMEAIIPILIQ